MSLNRDKVPLINVRTAEVLPIVPKLAKNRRAQRARHSNPGKICPVVYLLRCGELHWEFSKKYGKQKEYR
jgi:hypothetical protein